MADPSIPGWQRAFWRNLRQRGYNRSMVPPKVPPEGARPVPAGPSLETWKAMTPEARERFLVGVLDALSDPADTMTEGRPHEDAKARAIDLLGLHFRTMDRAVYVAEEMAVVYPGQPSFSPDVLAVLDVVQPAKDERLAWVVADEARGLDFVLEVLHHGNRQKDLVDNVQRYARLSIPEYFVYDRARQEVHGYRLGASLRYQRIVPQGGRTTSSVLGLDLAIQGGILRFFSRLGRAVWIDRSHWVPFRHGRRPGGQSRPGRGARGRGSGGAPGRDSGRVRDAGCLLFAGDAGARDGVQRSRDAGSVVVAGADRIGSGAGHRPLRRPRERATPRRSLPR